MFRRLTKKQLSNRDMSEKFGVTFTWTSVLTFVLFPVLLLSPLGFGAGTLAISWLFGVWLPFSMLMPAALFAALAFWIVHLVIRRFAPQRLAFALSCPIAFLIAVFGAFHINFDFFPPGVSIYGYPDMTLFSVSLAETAGLVSLFVAALVSAAAGGSV